MEIGRLDEVYKNAEIVCSPRLLINTNRSPDHTPGEISGKVIFKKVVHPEAPRFLEASSYWSFNPLIGYRNRSNSQW